MFFKTQLKDYPLYKIILIGDSSVGKTSIINIFKDRDDIDVNPTIGPEFTNSNPFLVGNPPEEICFQIWDTAGQEKYRSITSIHYRQVVGGLIIFDITNKNSFENVSKWCEELRYYSESDMIMFIVGNKTDKNPRQIKKERGEELAKQLDSEYYETSIINKESVHKVFRNLAERIYAKREIFKKMRLEKTKTIELPLPLENRKKCC